MLSRKYLFIFALLVAGATGASAQSLGDGLRLAREAVPSGARGLGMAGALVSAANDFTALDYNPAALAPIGFREFSISLFDQDHKSNSLFIDKPSTSDLNATSLASIGLAFPVPTTRGHFAAGISYDRIRDYSSTYSFKGINPNSSLFGTKAFIDDQGRPSGSLDDYRAELDQNNLAWALYLSWFDDTLNTRLINPLSKGGLEESGVVTEEGGMSALRFGGGIDVAPNVAIGGTLNVLFGTYDFQRNYIGRDVNGIYTNDPDMPAAGFQYAEIIDTRHQSQTGVNLKLGILAYPADLLRFGLTIETPTWYAIDDEAMRTGHSEFSNASYHSSSQPTLEPVTSNHYSIVTPLRISAGASASLIGITGAVSVSYADMSQTRYYSGVDEVDLSDLNTAARENLGSVVSVKFGAEYVIPFLGLAIRAGYGIEPSAYKPDPAEFGTKTLSFGASMLLSKSIALEAGWSQLKYRTDHVIYGGQLLDGRQANVTIPSDDVTRNQVAVAATFRF